MQVIKNQQSLAEAIIALENKQRFEENLLKAHFKHTLSSLNPINILRDKLKETFSAPDFKNKVVQGTLGLATGLLTNSIITSSTGNILNKILANVIQTGIAKITTYPLLSVKNSGISFLKKVLTKMKINPVT
jgi:hypothetical protein